MQCSVEIAITERRESELSRCGLIPLIHRKHSDAAIFISAQSLQRPTEFDEPEATANAALAARLPYIFACSRFAQYLKCIVRDKIGTFKGHAHMERWLSDWIASYVDANPASSSDEMRARKPLAGAEIEIDERSTSGRVLATFALRPHHQLEGLTINVRLKSHLPDLRSESGHYA
jgi:type VI secretion system protein ImpC